MTTHIINIGDELLIGQVVNTNASWMAEELNKRNIKVTNISVISDGADDIRTQLDRSLANKRVFPAVNIIASSTRRDDLLLDRQTLDRMWILRKYLSDMTPMEAMEFVKDRLERTKDNEEFLMSMNS